MSLGSLEERQEAIQGRLADVSLHSLCRRVGSTDADSTGIPGEAALIYNLGKFVEWPAVALPETRADMALCIVGEDPFGADLDHTMALLFDDPVSARQTLRAVDADQHILAAFMRRSDGRLFAEFRRQDAEAHVLPSEAEPEGHRYEGNRLVLSRGVVFGRERIGSITLLFDLHHIQDRLQEFAGIGALVLMAAVGVALVLSSDQPMPC